MFTHLFDNLSIPKAAINSQIYRLFHNIYEDISDKINEYS